MFIAYIIDTYKYHAKHRPIFMKLLSKLCLFFLLCLPQFVSANQQIESHKSIKKQANAYLQSLVDASNGQHEIAIQNLDQRLKLKKCPLPLEIQLVTEQIKTGKNTLKISCTSITPWRIFISSYIKLFTHVIVTTQPLAKGHKIKESDLMLLRSDITSLRSSYFSRKQGITNHITKRRLNRGTIISPKHLTKPILIKKGDTVSIIAKSDGFQIHMKGIAQHNASKGELIRVKNSTSKKIIQGIAVNSQTVRVQL